MPWPTSSGVYIVSAVPSRTLPRRREAPVTKHSASTSVVLPEPPCPSTATFLICSVRYSLAAVMRTSRRAGFRLFVGGPQRREGVQGVSSGCGGRGEARSCLLASARGSHRGAESLLTQRRGERGGGCRAGLRSSWNRAFLARIHVHVECGFCRWDRGSSRRGACRAGLAPPREP